MAPHLPPAPGGAGPKKGRRERSRGSLESDRRV